MNTADKMHAKALQNALLALDPTGSNGFEGFLGVILGEITGQSFRLAKSGTQRGRDGDSAFDGGATYFEGKRYKDGLSKNDITIKLFDVANDDTSLVDLWILGATCEVASQNVDDGRAFAAKHGFGITVLDWSNNDFGSLLIAAVASGAKSKAFITQGLTGRPEAALIAPASCAIDHFTNHSDFPVRASALRNALTEDVGLGQAKTFNQDWLGRLFKNKQQARIEFGQPLSPLDPSGPKALDRPERAHLTRAFSGVPDSDIYAVVGEEGVGKSWLTAQSWSLSDTKSLLIMCPADELIDDAGNFDDFLIHKLIRQTGLDTTQQTIKRWQRRFKAWRANIPASSVRVTLIADGLNQPLKSDWARWLDRAAQSLKALGGCLVVTTRTQHWAHVKSALSSSVKTIPLVEWSIGDVKKILVSRSIDFSKTRIEVLESVRNPRLLGIAIELIEANAIELLDELNSGRLLFEHMRKMQQHGAALISALAFVDLLKSLAAQVLTRAKAHVADDLRLFDAAQEIQLEAVASSRFFSSVNGSASKYEIKHEGLNLALALYLVEQLERELRNQRDPREKLARILEPISALDETAEVALLATQVACLDEETSPKVRSALIEKFVSLQNLPKRQVDAFSILAKSAHLAFLQAAENVYLAQEHFASKEWLRDALLKRRNEPHVWQSILESTKRWLSFYSLAPERQMYRAPSHYSDAKVDEERAKILAGIEDRKTALTDAERSYITTNLIAAPHPGFDGISRFAFYLLASMPLAQVAPCLVRWRFSNALNQSISAPYEAFEQVLLYNRTDWHETRAALLKELETLSEERSSSVGRWTRVGILHGTGDIGDAQESARIYIELTNDLKVSKGWSLIESYCTVDPCDPGTTEPENVLATAQNYRKIAPGELAQNRQMGKQDHFFRAARAGVARFVPDDAIHTHRALAEDVLSRNAAAQRLGVLELIRHSAALTKDLALRFLSPRESCIASCEDDEDHSDDPVTAQFSKLIAFPHLTAEEQFDALAITRCDNILLEQLYCVRKASPIQVEQVLERVLRGGDEHAQTSVIAAIHFSKSLLTPRTVAIAKGFIRSPFKSLRQQTLALAASSGEKLLLQEVVDSGWCAEKPANRDSSFEDWYGSAAILEALQSGLIEMGPALERMSLSHYGFAAEALPAGQGNAIAERIEIALVKSLRYAGDLELPDISTETPKKSDPTPALASLTERAPPENDFASQIRRFSETHEQFDERQRRMNETYKSFASELTALEADLILSDLTFAGIKAIIGSDTDRGKRWLDMLIAAPDRNLRHLHHVALQVAMVLSDSNISSVPDFVSRTMALDPTIRRVTGSAKISVAVISLWSNAINPAMVDICIRRLRAPRTDSEIASEVMAAHLGGKLALLQTYIDELLTIDRPYETALALTITGFCDESIHADAILSRFDGAAGFISTVHAAARDAYSRNIWAKTWYAEMLSAQRPEDFWRASVLFMKIIDGRFDVWSEVVGEPSAVFTAFMPTLNQEISKRAAKVQKARGKELFGEKAPSLLMLSAE